jgi:hypothetical protein
VEPYVDKIFRHLAATSLCVVVLDNIDLYEDEELEKTVFSEGLAFSKRIYCNVIVTIRETTFVKHKTNSAFDAYELRKLWLDAPDFKAVLSARLTYAKKILEDKYAKIDLRNGMHLEVPDLSVFFDIVQRSVLQGLPGDFIDYMTDANIRRGLTLVTNLLTSGHIQADRAIANYIKGETRYSFPMHEVFKGTMLGQWKYFKEGRADCINLFDARLGSKNLRLLRFHLLNLLLVRARSEASLEVAVKDCTLLFSNCGASEAQIVVCLEFLCKHGLVRNSSAEGVQATSSVTITRTGGYYVRVLCNDFPYIEACLLDTAIEDHAVWDELQGLTLRIEKTRSLSSRMELRVKRIEVFLNYLERLEFDVIDGAPGVSALTGLSLIKAGVAPDIDKALAGARRYEDQKLQ